MGCPHCGTLQHLGEPLKNSVSTCVVCQSELDRTAFKTLPAALACSLSVLLLLIPANLLPFLTTSIFGVSRHSIMASSARAMWTDGWPLLALMIGLFVIVLPLVRFALLTAVLGCLQIGVKPNWLGPSFRWASQLQQWAMLDVFLVGLWIAYARLSATISVEVGAGAVCFVAAAVLSLAARATLNQGHIWRLIAPDSELPAHGAVCSCLACDFTVPATREGLPCPRCGDRICAREKDTLGRTIALTLAGILLYIPANILPIATLPIGLHPTQYNIFQGVIDLSRAGLFGLALLVFTASFAIPMLKLVGLGYCVLSVLRRSRQRLILKTRIYRIVEEIGRWSMVDPFVIACFVPVMQYNAFIFGRAESAAPMFACVVVVTMIAARAFDPRLMWDAALSAIPAPRRFA